MAGHKRLAPSAAHRWMNCSGSVNLIESLGDKAENGTNEYAEYGTVAHLIAAQCLSDNREPWEFIGQEYESGGFNFTVDEEMSDCIQVYIDTVRDDHKKYGGTLLVETSGDLDGVVGTDCGGTLDAGFVGADNVARIYDLKTGFVVVEPEGNEQLQIYGTQFAKDQLSSGKPSHIKALELVIVQPRASHSSGPVRRWRMDYEDLAKWVEYSLKPLAEETRKDDAELQQGSWCKYCPARNHCPEIQKRVEMVVAQAGEGMDVDSMEPWELAEVKELESVVKDYFKRVDERIYSLMIKDSEVPGYKLVRSSSRRVWQEEAESEAPRKFFDLKFLTPAQVAKKGKEGQDFVNKWATKPEGKLTVASEDDRRPAERPEGNAPNAVFGDMING